MTTFAWGSATDIGKVRTTNQDQLLTADPVFVVADGMGGHAGGEVAAAIAVDEMAKVTEMSSLNGLVEVIQNANREIVDRAKLEPELRGMGTTVVALVGMTLEGEDRIAIANVGDSRLYLRTPDALVQLTEDHSLVEALVRDGRLSREDAATHPQRNIVTRALGIDEKALVDAWELVPVAGDRYLLCTDGLFDELDETTILDTLHSIDEPARAATILVDAACDAGGRDNVTVMVVDVVETDREMPDPPIDRVVATYKAIPDAVERLEAGQMEHGPSDPHPDEIYVDRSDARPPFLTWRLGLFVAAVLIVLAILAASLVAYARSSYFIGIDGQDVVIYRGQEGGVLWFDPTVEERIGVTVAGLDADDLAAVSDGIGFDSLDEARQRGDELRQRSSTDESP